MDICYCKTARKLPPPSQDEGLLLRFFRKFYVPFLLHWLTRVVVVSGREGQQGDLMPPRAGGAWQCLGREGLLSLDPCSWSSEGSGACPGPGVEAGAGMGVLRFKLAQLQNVSYKTPSRPRLGSCWVGGFQVTLPFPGAALPGPVRSEPLFHVLH